MRINVTEQVETVGWNEAMLNAPAALMNQAKVWANNGFPVVIGKIARSQAWCIVVYDQAGLPRIEYQAEAPTANEQPKA